jgi:regulator of sigma E protease
MTAILFIAVLAVLVFVHELGHFAVAKKLKVLVHEFALGFPPKIISKKIGETVYSINLIPFGGYVKIEGEDSPEEGNAEAVTVLKERSLFFRPAWQKIAVLVAGVSANIVLAWLLVSLSMSSGMTTSISADNIAYATNARVLVTEIAPNSPAFKAKIEAGTSIIAIADDKAGFDKTVSSVEEVQSIVQNSNGHELTLRVLYKDNTEGIISLTPEKGIVGKGYGIGVSMDFVGDLRLPIYKAFWEGARATGFMIWNIVMGLWNLFSGIFHGSADLTQVAGPVGIANLVGEAKNLGLAYFMSFVAFISLNLAVLNLVPFPALDGGRILFVIIEKIKGSAIPPKIANTVNAVGFGLLMILMLVITVRDILKLF